MRTCTILAFFSGGFIPKNSPIANFSLDSYAPIDMTTVLVTLNVIINKYVK
jgi:hypothetical protein